MLGKLEKKLEKKMGPVLKEIKITNKLLETQNDILRKINRDMNQR